MTGGGEGKDETVVALAAAWYEETYDQPWSMSSAVARADFLADARDFVDRADCHGFRLLPPPVWVPLAERWPGDGEVVWVTDGCGVWGAEAGETPGPDALRCLRGASSATVVYSHQPLVASLSWVPASVPEPPEEEEVKR